MCRSILTSWSRLVTYKRLGLVSKFVCLVSAGEANISVSDFNVSCPSVAVACIEIRQSINTWMHS